MQKSIHTPEQLALQGLLRELRKEAGLTQLEMAARLRVAPSRISEYETAGRRMDVFQLRQYCAALGLTLREFVDRLDALLPGPDGH